MGDDSTIDISDLEIDLKDLESADGITITLDTNDLYQHNAGYIDSLYTTDSVFTVNTAEPIEFEDTMPSLYRIQAMCEQYPALNKAWENFKTIYKMVDQDYKGNFEDDIPF